MMKFNNITIEELDLEIDDIQNQLEKNHAKILQCDILVSSFGSPPYNLTEDNDLKALEKLTLFHESLKNRISELHATLTPLYKSRKLKRLHEFNYESVDWLNCPISKEKLLLKLAAAMNEEDENIIEVE